MKTLGKVFVVLGLLLIWGAAGRSDCQSLYPASDNIPFGELVAIAIAGLILFCCGLWVTKRGVE